MVRQDLGRRLALFLSAGYLSIGPWISDQAYAATSDPARSEAFFEDARKFLKKGDTNAAIIQLENALQQDPNNVAARLKIYTVPGIRSDTITRWRCKNQARSGRLAAS